jgi:hypothetical protein
MTDVSTRISRIQSRTRFHKDRLVQHLGRLDICGVGCQFSEVVMDMKSAQSRFVRSKTQMRGRFRGGKKAELHFSRLATPVDGETCFKRSITITRCPPGLLSCFTEGRGVPGKLPGVQRSRGGCFVQQCRFGDEDGGLSVFAIRGSDNRPTADKPKIVIVRRVFMLIFPPAPKSRVL